MEQAVAYLAEWAENWLIHVKAKLGLACGNLGLAHEGRQVGQELKDLGSCPGFGVYGLCGLGEFP